jgi:hypothetical protein
MAIGREGLVLLDTLASVDYIRTDNLRRAAAANKHGTVARYAAAMIFGLKGVFHVQGESDICAAILSGVVSSQAFAVSIGSGNGNGNGNVGFVNGNGNGNANTGFVNGNGNGNFNTGALQR